MIAPLEEVKVPAGVIREGVNAVATPIAPWLAGYGTCIDCLKGELFIIFVCDITIVVPLGD